MDFYIALSQDSLEKLEREALPAAISGEKDAAKLVLTVLSAAIRQGFPLTPLLAGYLSTRLQAIADGGDPKRAFGIKRKRGERDTSKAVERAVLRALKVAVLRRQNPGMSVETAIAQVASADDVPEDTIRAAWRDYRKSISFPFADSDTAFFEY